MLSLLPRHEESSPVARTDGGPVRAGALVFAAEAVAARLDRGGAGDTVVVACEGRLPFLTALLGVWRSGRRVALPSSGQEAVVCRLADAHGLEAVLHDREAPGIDVRPFVTTPRSAASSPVRIALPDDAPVARFYTSGTTSNGKPVEKTARQLLGEAYALVAMGLVPSHGTVLATVPPFHLYGLLFGVLAPLVGGGSLVTEAPFFPRDVLATAKAYGAKVLVSAPPHLRALAQAEPDAALASLRVVSSGAPLAADVHEALALRHGWLVVDVLGSTETGGMASRRKPGGRWAPFEGVRVGATDDGDLLLWSPFLPADEPLPYRAADKVLVFGDGTFEHRGRSDRVVKVAGRRVDLGEMEERARGILAVSDAAVLAEPTNDGRGQRLRLAVACESGAVTTSGIRAALRAFYDDAVLPRSIVLVESLPRERTGKLPLHRLRELFASAATSAGADFDVRRRDEAVPKVEVVTIEAGTPDTVTFEVSVPQELRFCEGHFPERPIVPAVAQLEELVAKNARGTWADLGGVESLSRLRFRAPVEPGDDLVLSLARDRGRAVRFELRRGTTVCSSGLLTFRARGAP